MRGRFIFKSRVLKGMTFLALGKYRVHAIDCEGRLATR
jgi:hypothetical protein